MRQVWPLPPKAQEELKKAALVEPTPKDPNARIKAIDRATDRLRLLYPTHFREEDDNATDTRE